MSDRGLNNRGASARVMVNNGFFQSNSGIEVHEHLGRGERHGDQLKKIAKRLIKVFKVVGKKQMKSVTYVAVEVKNEGMPKGGVAPSQWVIGKFPRQPGGMCEEEVWGQLELRTRLILNL